MLSEIEAINMYNFTKLHNFSLVMSLYEEPVPLSQIEQLYNNMEESFLAAIDVE